MDAQDAAAGLSGRIPPAVRGLMDELRGSGHDAYVVGGSVRDHLLGREPGDWDLTTDATPDELRAVFPDARYENRFGTVVVARDGIEHEITTYRSERGYADHRRPDVVDFGTTLVEDLARRDFTVNAMAWGVAAGAPADGPGTLVDPFDGRRDLAAGRIRAVGDPDARFTEDALRMLRAVRLAATLDFRIDPETRAGIVRRAPDAALLSGERVGAEVQRTLLAPRPSIGLRQLEETGLLAVVLPELALQPGIPQAKVVGEDLWDHTLGATDAASAGIVPRFAALLHDVGKPATFADGRFFHHDVVGARMADEILDRLRLPRETRERVVRLVRHHMFSYEPGWSDAAVRRLIGRVGPDLLEDLFDLRAADDVGSGLPADPPALVELRQRCRDQLAANVPLRRADLAIDGRDLMAGLRLAPGPRLGHILDRLVVRVVDDPALNTRPALLALARAIDRNLEDR
jgi:putative nucleotidyltransferase with HDIG domain